MSIHDEECSGCPNYNFRKSYTFLEYDQLNRKMLLCDLPSRHHDIKCPCINCLVKITCQNTEEECELYRNYVRRISTKYFHFATDDQLPCKQCKKLVYCIETALKVRSVYDSPSIALTTLSMRYNCSILGRFVPFISGAYKHPLVFFPTLYTLKRNRRKLLEDLVSLYF